MDDLSGDDVLLPNKFLTPDMKEEEYVDVFVYRDSEDRIVATTQTPHVRADQFAFLKVKDLNPVGAFMDWGLDKDLLVPFREQKMKMKPDQWYLIYLYLDEKSDRLVATAKVDKFYDKTIEHLQEDDKVELLVAHTTDAGINVVVNNRYRGLIFHSEIYQDLLPGDQTYGFVRKVREDGKLDIALRKKGLENLQEGAQTIVDELESSGGFLPVNDKSSPEEIQSLLQMSKKNFKKSVGILYKQKAIKIDEEGIHLLNY